MIELLLYKKGDESEIFKLVATVLNEYNLETNMCSTDSDLIDIEKNYIKNDGIFKVLREDKKIIGSYGLYKLSGKSCELRKMYIYSKYRGKGFGKLMLDDALETTKNMGFTSMILETNRVLVEAKGLYQKYGFREYVPDHLSARCDIAMKMEF